MSVIEFVGMVGSGKTTLAHELAILLKQRGFVVLDRVSAIQTAMLRSPLGAFVRQVIRSEPLQAILLLNLYRFIVRPGSIAMFTATNLGLIRSVRSAPAYRILPRWHRKTISRLFFRTAATASFVRARLEPEEILILEEGLHHRAVNLFSWDPSPVRRNEVQKYLDALPPADLVLAVEAPAPTCEARAASRGMPRRLDDQSEATTQQFMTNAATIVELVLESLERGSHPMIRIWNGGSLEEALKTLVDGLDVHFSSVATP